MASASRIPAATNVKAALKELGLDVTLEDAAAVWIRYSNAMCAAWMAGAETPRHAKLALISYCALGTDDFMRGALQRAFSRRKKLIKAE